MEKIKKIIRKLRTFGSDLDSSSPIEDLKQHLTPYVKNLIKLSDPEVYKKLFNEYQVILFGDTSHKEPGNTAGLANIVKNLKDVGISYLALELPQDEKYEKVINEFNETGDISKIIELAKFTRTPIRFIELLKNAHDSGLKIYLIDMPKKLSSKLPENKRARKRGKYMGEKICELTEKTGSKIAVFCGAAHLTKDQILGKLDSKNISYKSITLVTENQPSLQPFRIPLSFSNMSIVETIKERGLSNEYVYVDLEKEWSVIYSPEPELTKIDIDLRNFISEEEKKMIEAESTAEKVSDKIIAQIRDAILSGQLKPGDSLELG